MPVSIKTPAEIEKMRTAGKLAAEVLELIQDSVVEGVTTDDLDKLCHEHIVNVQKATPVNALFSDAYLMILSNKNNPIVQVDFHDLYPVALSGLEFNNEATDVQYLTATAQFSYQIYEFSTVT